MTDANVQALQHLLDEVMSLPSVDRDVFIAKQTQIDPLLGNNLADLVKHASAETT